MIIFLKSFNSYYLLAIDSSSSPAELAFLHSRSKNPACGGNQAFWNCESSHKQLELRIEKSVFSFWTNTLIIPKNILFI